MLAMVEFWIHPLTQVALTFRAAILNRKCPTLFAPSEKYYEFPRPFVSPA
jgi:hypothetical protein